MTTTKGAKRMRLKDLKKALEPYDDDAFVFITQEGNRSVLFIDKVTETRQGQPVLTSNEAPTFDDLEGLADACWDEHYKDLNELERSAILEFSQKARDAEIKRRMT